MKQIFIDESGNFGFKFETTGDTRFFILSAIICDTNNAELIESKLEKIAQEKHSGVEFKSKKFIHPKNYEEIFSNIKKYDYKIFSLVVDKTKIWTDSGLHKNKAVFYKYISKKFYDLLEIHYPKISITYDEIGRTEFMDSFKEYMNKKFQGNLKLFNTTNEGDFAFSFKNSKDSRLIQLADLVSGSIKRFLENKDKRLVDNFEDRFFIRKFPNYTDEIEIDTSSYTNEEDKKVLSATIKAIRKYFQEYKGVVSYKNHIKLLEFLLSEFDFDSSRYIQKNRIEKNLEIGVEEIQRIISDLRDYPILISSCRDGGYKISNSVNDIIEFIDNFHLTTKSMILKMNSFNDVITSFVGIDILSNEKYEYIKISSKKLLK